MDPGARSTREGESPFVSILSCTSNSTGGVGRSVKWTAPADTAVDVVQSSCRGEKRERSKKERASLRTGYIPRHRGSGTLGTAGFISRPERTHLANAVDFVVRRRTVGKNRINGTRTRASMKRSARSVSKESWNEIEYCGMRFFFQIENAIKI